MNAYDRLLLEAIPVRPAPAVHSQWTKEEQDQHWEELARALRISSADRPKKPADSEATA